MSARAPNAIDIHASFGRMLHRLAQTGQLPAWFGCDENATARMEFQLSRIYRVRENRRRSSTNRLIDRCPDPHVHSEKRGRPNEDRLTPPTLYL